MNLIRATLLPTSVRVVVCLLACVLCTTSWAQTHDPAPVSGTTPPIGPAASPVAPAAPPPLVPSTPARADDSAVPDSSPAGTPQLRIGPGDELDVSVYGVPDLSQHVRVENTGDIFLALIDRIHVAGLSSDQAQAVIERRLSSGGFINNPHVTVFVKEYTSDGIVVQGQVNKPGVYPAFGHRRLSDLLLQAGGITQTAGSKVSILHPGQTVPEVVTLSAETGQGSSIDVSAGDTITVSKAGIVYVIGEVSRPGGFVLQSNDETKPEAVSAMQAIALAAGPTHTASLNKARVIRRTPSGIQEISLPLKKIMEGKSPDVQLEAEDILFIPNSRAKAMAEQGSTSILSILASAAIYHF